MDNQNLIEAFVGKLHSTDLVNVVDRINRIKHDAYDLSRHEVMLMQDLKDCVIEAYTAMNYRLLMQRAVDYINVFNIIVKPRING